MQTFIPKRANKEDVTADLSGASVPITSADGPTSFAADIAMGEQSTLLKVDEGYLDSPDPGDDPCRPRSVLRAPTQTAEVPISTFPSFAASSTGGEPTTAPSSPSDSGNTVNVASAPIQVPMTIARGEDMSWGTPDDLVSRVNVVLRGVSQCMRLYLICSYILLYYLYNHTPLTHIRAPT